MNSIRSRQVQIASRSDVGRVRPANQDVCGEFENAEGYQLLVVADGMGGHQGGETASRLALETIGRVFDRDFGAAETLLVRAFRAANDEIHRVGASDPSLRGMGTTGVAILIGPSDEGWVAHVGDSRAYRLRNGRFDQITEDHSWVCEEVRQGRISTEEASEHPMKNVLLRSIGVGSDVDVSASAIDLRSGDCFLLCSDGLWGELDDPAIAEVLAREPPSSAAGELVDLANAHGGRDNVTVLVAAVIGGDEAPAIAMGIDGPTEVPGPSRLVSQPGASAPEAQSDSPDRHSIWTPHVVIAATLVTAMALFWRLCA
jgi:protein phosphatase